MSTDCQQVIDSLYVHRLSAGDWQFVSTFTDCQRVIEKSIDAARNFTQSDSDNFSCPEPDHEPGVTVCLCPTHSVQGLSNFTAFVIAYLRLISHVISV